MDSVLLKIEDRENAFKLMNRILEAISDYKEIEQKLIKEKAYLAEKLFGIFRTEKIRKQAVEIISRYSENYFAGVDKENKVVQLQRIAHQENEKYIDEVTELLMTDSHLNAILASNINQSAASRLTAHYLPKICNIANFEDSSNLSVEDIQISILEILFPNINIDELVSRSSEQLNEFKFELEDEVEKLTATYNEIKLLGRKYNIE